MKKSHFVHIALSLGFILSIVSCTMSDEAKVRKVATKFADLYFNLDIRKSKDYCTYELYPVMDHRNAIIKEKDIIYQQKAGKATVEIVKCDINIDNEIAYVKMAVNNFLRVNYMTDSLFIVPRDTFEIVLTKELDNVWRIKIPTLR